MSLVSQHKSSKTRMQKTKSRGTDGNNKLSDHYTLAKHLDITVFLIPISEMPPIFPQSLGIEIRNEKLN